MKNLKMNIKDNKLVITIDLDERIGESKSGKTTIIATTSGNVKLDPPYDDIAIGINCYTKE